MSVHKQDAMDFANSEVDVAIVGGGLVGSSLACALHDAGYSVAMVEATAGSLDSSPPGFDDRSIALAYGSQQIFSRFGLWQGIAEYATPIRQIHVSDRGAPGFVRMQAAQEDLPALGYVVVARELGNALHRALQQRPAIQLHSPARVSSVQVEAERVLVQLQSADKAQNLASADRPSGFACRLLVGADGANSGVRSLLQMGESRRDYQQTAVVANVLPGRDHQGLAFERFTRRGPLALLPLSEGRCALIWSAQDELASDLMAASDEEFLARLQRQFGYRLGRFQRIGKRFSYPLSLVESREQARSRVVLLGNAAHALHPVGGQGFNLGLRDVAGLVDTLAEARHDQRDPGDGERLQDYANRRQRDQFNVSRFTDALATAFLSPSMPYRLLRSLGLLGLEVLPGAKPWLAGQAMGARRWQMHQGVSGQ